MLEMKYLQLVLLVVSLSCGADGFRRPFAVSRNNKNNQHLLHSNKHAGSITSTPVTRQVLLDGQTSLARLQPSATTSTALYASTQKFKNFDEVLASSAEMPLMVIFTAVNCGPCKLMKQEMRQVSSMTQGQFRIFKVDTEKWPHVGKQFQVAALPCLLLVKNGEPLLRIEGVLKAEEVVERVKTITPL